MRVGIIPVAGKGLRFKDLGKQYPKSILPYNGKPIIVHNIEWLKRHGCTEFRIIVGHQRDKIITMVEKYFPNENIEFFYQDEVRGLSSAINLALHSHSQESLIVLGDLIVQDDIPKETFENNFISAKKVDDYSRWCMVELNKDVVSEFIDKPMMKPNTNLAVSGVYFFKDGAILKEKIEEQLSRKQVGEYQFSVAMEMVEDIHIIYPEIKDFGTLKEYLENKGLRNSRDFNDVEIGDIFINKSSNQASKMIAELNWYNNLPDDLQLMTPRIVSSNLFGGESVTYKMERIFAPTLREIYLYLDSSEETWDDIFNKLFHATNLMRKYKSPEGSTFMDKMFEKTRLRIDDIDVPVVDWTVQRFLIDFEMRINEMKTQDNLIHGDFCFSNIFYDIQMNRVKFIDPRGETFGCHYYDVAKICHSVLYDYDYIDSELYTILGDSHVIYTDGKDEVKKLFREKLHERYTEEELSYIILITASLFLSMIPLHGHNIENQKAYYRKFEEIYEEYRNLHG